MGNSLHNKIYLGRHSVFRSRSVQVAALAGAMAAFSLLWVALQALK